MPTVLCGTVQVPLDWGRPSGPTITLGVARRPADQATRRVGVLFVNPGGPGGSGVEVTKFAEFFFSPALRAGFDIIGVDPRGVGTSTQVRCSVPLYPAGITLFPRTEQQFQRLVAYNRKLGLSCLRATGPLLGHVDAVSVARDFEAVRGALGERRLTFLGLSYGTLLGATYAQLFPGRVRAMALDAALDHELADLTRVADEAVTVEDAFTRFARWCSTATECVLKGQNVRRLFDRLVANADRHPIPVPGASRPVTGEDIRLNIQDKLLIKLPIQPAQVFGTGWAGLAQALAALRAGDARAFATPRTSGPTDSRYAELAIGCMDLPSEVRSYADMRRRIRLGRVLAPHLEGASQTWRLAHCIGWPVPAANPPQPLHVRGVPPILIVHATHDGSTNYRWAHGLAAQINRSVLLTRHGDGHTSYFTSPCARAAIDRYLITRVTPRPGFSCRN